MAQVLDLRAPGSLIEDKIAGLAAPVQDIARTKALQALDAHVRIGDVPIFVERKLAPGKQPRRCQVLPVLITERLRLPEDEIANDGRYRHAVTIDLQTGRAKVDFRAIKLFAYEHPDKIPGGERVRYDSRGPAPIPDDEASRFVQRLEKDGAGDGEPLLVRVSSEAAVPVIDAVLQEVLAEHQPLRPASESEIREELETYKAECERSGKRPGNKKARLSWLRNRLRLRGRSTDLEVASRVDNELFDLPRGRPKSAP